MLPTAPWPNRTLVTAPNALRMSDPPAIPIPERLLNPHRYFGLDPVLYCPVRHMIQGVF